MIIRYRPYTKSEGFEELVRTAQHAIDERYPDSQDNNRKQRQWLQKILNLLKCRKYVTIQDNKGMLRDVSKIAYTHSFLSFFDVCHEISWFDLDVEPIETVKLDETHISYGFSCLFV